MTRRCPARALALGTAAAAIFSAAQLWADPAPLSCEEAVGTYLTTKRIDKDGDQTVIGRSLLSLTGSGLAFFSDSAQGGFPGYQPFGEASGAWSCADSTSGPQLSVTLLDFTYATESAPDQQIARVDTSAHFDTETGLMIGETNVAFTPLDGNPLDSTQLKNPISYHLEGERVTAPAPADPNQ